MMTGRDVSVKFGEVRMGGKVGLVVFEESATLDPSIEPILLTCHFGISLYLVVVETIEMRICRFTRTSQQKIRYTRI